MQAHKKIGPPEPEILAGAAPARDFGANQIDKGTPMTADVSTLIQQARDSKFWGSIQIDFQDGKPILIRRTETMKPTAEGTPYGKTNRPQG